MQPQNPQSNPEKIKRFLPGLIHAQPHREELLDRLFKSRGFLDLKELVRLSGNTANLLARIGEEREHGNLGHPQQEEAHGVLVGAYMRTPAAYGGNPLDNLVVVDAEKAESVLRRRKVRRPIQMELGSVHADGYVEINSLYSDGKGRRCCFKREGLAAIAYLLDQDTNAA